MQRQPLLAILFFIVLLGIGYVWYSYSKNSAPPPAGAPSEAIGSSEARLAQLRKLKNLQLDTDILGDEFFKSLVLPAEGTPPGQSTELKGRANPFFAP